MQTHDPSAETQRPKGLLASLRVNIAIAVGLSACPLMVLAGVAADYLA